MKTKLRLTMILFTTLPIIALGCFFIPLGMNSVRSSSEIEISNTLNGVCMHLRDEFCEKYPGEYHIENGKYYAGDVEIKEAQNILEKYKSEFNAEVTIFIGNERAVTTIEDDYGRKIIGTLQNDERVLESVFAGNSFSAADVMIGDIPYYVTYYPIFAGEEVVGMVFAGISSQNFAEVVSRFDIQIIAVTLFIVMAALMIVLMYSNEMIQTLLHIREYLGNLADSKNMDIEMTEDVVKRPDEIGELARYAVTIGEELRSIMGRDPLTGLYNRRAGRHMLDRLCDESMENGLEYCLIMCDIDRFKDINDRYGHGTGDKVLKKVSEIIRNFVAKHHGAFAIRWGGEESLIGFPRDLDETLVVVESLRKEIKRVVFDEGGCKFCVSITFGVASSEDYNSIHDLIEEADSLMYVGKNAGRDKVVTKYNKAELAEKSEFGVIV